MDEIVRMRERMAALERWALGDREERLKASIAEIKADVAKRKAEIAAAEAPPAPPEPAERTFRASEIADRAFYEKNRDAILQAAREDRIVDDDLQRAAAAAPQVAAPAPATTGSADGGARGSAAAPRITEANLNDRAFYEAVRPELERRARAHLPLLDE